MELAQVFPVCSSTCPHPMSSVFEAAPNNSTPVWRPEPNTRRSFNILSTCVLTLIACLWTTDQRQAIRVRTQVDKMLKDLRVFGSGRHTGVELLGAASKTELIGCGHVELQTGNTCASSIAEDKSQRSVRRSFHLD